MNTLYFVIVLIALFQIAHPKPVLSENGGTVTSGEDVKNKIRDSTSRDSSTVTNDIDLDESTTEVAKNESELGNSFGAQTINDTFNIFNVSENKTVSGFGFFAAVDVPWLSSIVLPVRLPSGKITENSIEQNTTDDSAETETTTTVNEKVTATAAISTTTNPALLKKNTNVANDKKTNNKSTSSEEEKDNDSASQEEEDKEEKKEEELKEKVAEVEAEPVILTQGV